jgi:hypothetical protein
LFPFVFFMSIVHSKWCFELFEKKMWMTYNITSKQFTTFKLESVYMAKFFLWTMWCTHTKGNPILTNLIGDNILQALEHQNTIYIKVDSLIFMLSVESLLETKASMIIEVILSYPKPSISCEKHKKIESLTDHYITYTCIPT